MNVRRRFPVLVVLAAGALSASIASAQAGDDPTTTPAAADPVASEQAEAPTETTPPPEQPPVEEAPLPTAPADEAAPGTDDRTMSHQLQVGVRVGFGFSYLFAIKYGDGAECSPTMETFCRYLVGGLIDVELGFGVTEGLEVSFLGRFGLANEPTAQNIPIVLGLGIRGYIPPTAAFKLYIGARLILDLTQSDDALWQDVDFGARAEIGLQYDILRYLGLYVQLGITIQILRALAFPIDVTGGLQARFP